MVGTHLPRQCGIATFTNDLCDALETARPKLQCMVLPINDNAEGYQYPHRARFELSDRDHITYHQAAAFLNLNDVDAVLVQHE
ncbi:MAG: glycosyl transferase family 1, partial [Verrucomicrobiota bacterium]|nr:glycosyl transferase family 1 [Verrucomicrobiota bacterium]